MIRRRGIMLADAVLALVLISAMTVALTWAAVSVSRARQRIDDSKRAALIAEQVLLDLRAGRPAPASAEGASVKVCRIEKPAAAQGKQWVEVQVTYQGRMSSLAGVVPGEALR